MNRETSIRLVNGFLESELNTIKEAYTSSYFKSNHLDASQAIAWSCYIFKDWITGNIKNQLINFASELIDGKCSWLNIPCILAASYIFEENKNIRDHLFNNVSHGSSITRKNILESIGFIAPLVSFNNSTLRNSVRINISRRYFWYQESAILYLSTNGTDADKRRWALRANKHYKNHEDHQLFFETLLESPDYYESSFYSEKFSNAKSYLIFKLITSPSLSNHQANLFGEKKNADELMQYLQEREKEHPLTHSQVDISSIKEKDIGLFKKD